MNEKARRVCEQINTLFPIGAKDYEVANACTVEGMRGLAIDAREALEEIDVSDARIADLEAMLDRIAAVKGIEFDPRSEECVADGVEGLADHATSVEQALDDAVLLIRALRLTAGPAGDAGDMGLLLRCIDAFLVKHGKETK